MRNTHTHINKHIVVFPTLSTTTFTVTCQQHSNFTPGDLLCSIRANVMSQDTPIHLLLRIYAPVSPLLQMVSGNGFEVLRRVYVDFEGISLRRKFLTGLEPESINMTIGEYVYIPNGTLFPM